MKTPILSPVLIAATLAAFASTGCADPQSSATNCSPISLDRAVLVLESDESASSALGKLETNGCFHEVADVSLGTQPMLSFSAGKPFLTIRDQGLVFEIDPETVHIKRSVPALREGEPQPNPWDVAVDGVGRLWIARYNLTSAAIIEPDGTWAGVVDLSSLADEDGMPEMAAVTVSGGRAFIAVERLRAEGPHWMPTGPGLIAVAAAEPPFTLEAPIELTGSNPFGRLTPVLSDPSGDTVTIVTPGDFDAVDAAGGVERVRLSTREHSVIITEAELGGSATEAVVASDTEGYAIVAGPEAGSNPTSVVRFDPSTGHVTQTLARPASGFVHWGLALNGPHLLVGDRTYGAQAIHVFNRESGAKEAAITPKLLPPVSLVTLN